MNRHPGYAKHAFEGNNAGNYCNGVRAKTMLTDIVGTATVEVPHNLDGSLRPNSYRGDSAGSVMPTLLR